MKHSDDLLVAKVFSCCLKKSRSIDDITSRVYGNGYSTNKMRVFQMVECLIGEGIVVPKVNGGHLLFQINQDVVKELIG